MGMVVFNTADTFSEIKLFDNVFSSSVFSVAVCRNCYCLWRVTLPGYSLQPKDAFSPIKFHITILSTSSKLKIIYRKKKPNRLKLVIKKMFGLFFFFPTECEVIGYNK